MEQRRDSRRALHLVASRWYVVLGICVLVVAAALGYVRVSEPIYETQARVTYTPPPRDEGLGNAYPNTGDRTADMETLRGYAAGDPSLVATIAEQAGVEVGELEQAVRVQVDGGSSHLLFIARGDSPEQVALLANTYAKTFAESRNSIASTSLGRRIKVLEDELGKIARTDDTAFLRATMQADLQELRQKRASGFDEALSVTEAAMPDMAVWPNTILIAAASLVVGLGLGIGGALLMASFDRKVREDELELLPLPVAVKVPRSDRAPAGEPLSPATGDAAVMDSFAAHGSRLMLNAAEGQAYTVLVTSAVESEAKSSVASHLAASLAQTGRRVVLIDADMRRPTQHVVFPVLAGRPGLSQVLTGQSDVEHALTLVAPNLAAIGAGATHINASSLVASLGFHTMLERLSQISGVIVIDAPPVLPVTDALALAPRVDHVLVSVRLGRSHVGEVEDATMRLQSAAATPQSLVLVGAQKSHRYGYGYSSTDPARRALGNRGGPPPPPGGGTPPPPPNGGGTPPPPPPGGQRAA